MKATLLVIECRRQDIPTFSSDLRRKGYTVDVVSNGKGALEYMDEVGPDLIVVNAAALRTSGVRICKSLRSRMDGVPIVLIWDEEIDKPKEIPASEIMLLPFTTRKLANRIETLLPSGGGKLLSAGPIRLDLERKRVRCLDKSERLTPHLVQLLQMFIDHQGEVLEREHLFSTIWETDYTDDMRTLDVHISWLRKAIEPDPKKPRFIKTLRGVGYRLDV
ncbi:MAG: response regulator transcription factor [Chloroflexota bacterium]